MQWFGGATNEPVAAPGTLSLEDVLPPSIELTAADDGATFEVSVADVKSGDDPRIAALAKLIPGHRFKHVAKALGLAPYNRKNNVFLPESTAATADPKAINSKLAAKLMGAANQRKKTKGAFLEAFAVGLGGGTGGGETLTLRVKTCFDRSSMTAEEVDWSFSNESIVKGFLRALGLSDVDGLFVGCEVAGAKGRKERTATVTVTLSGSSGAEAGASARAAIAPVGFQEVGGRVVRSIY